MTFCLVMLGVFMLFGYFSQKHSEKLAVAQGRAWGPDEHGVYARLEVWSVALILIVVFVCGLRVKYNDTVNYIGGFVTSPTLGELIGTQMHLGDCPGFLYLQAAVRSVTDNPHLFIMLCAAINVAPVLIFLKKYSNNFFFAMFLYVAAGQFLFSLAALKQAIAIAIAIWAIPLYLKKKYLAALVVLMLAALFHPYVLLYLTLPLLTSKPWGVNTLFIAMVIGGVAIFFQPSMQVVLGFAETLGDDFSDQSFAGTGVNVFRVLVYAMTPILSLIFLDRVRHDENKYQHTYINVAILCAGIMFLALFGTANLIGRVALYLSFSLSLSLPYIISRLEKKSAMALLGVAIILYFAYYLYANRNIEYAQITLREFIESILK